MTQLPRTHESNSPQSTQQKRPRGQQRQQEILESARNLLVEEGYAAFSARKVAQRVGIRLSNLQYYFPSFEDLIRALFEFALQDRAATPAQSESTDPEQARQGMLVTLSHFLESHKQRDQQVFLRELWALAAHDAAISSVMKTFYHQWIDRIARQLRVINPRISLPDAERRALLMISMVDGLSLFHGGEGLNHRANQGIEGDVVQWVLKIAMD